MGPFIFFPILIRRIKSIKYMIRDKSVPKRHKFLLVLGIMYLLSPIDLIPWPVLGPFGFIDDIVIWLFILSYLKEQLDRYGTDGKKADKENEKALKKELKGKKVINITEFKIKRDEEQKNKR